MTLSLYMDQNVEGPITSGLCQRGVNVLTALEDGTDHVDDDDLMDRATAPGHVLFTHDPDLLAIAHSRQAAGIAFSGLIFVAQM